MTPSRTIPVLTSQEHSVSNDRLVPGRRSLRPIALVGFVCAALGSPVNADTLPSGESVVTGQVNVARPDTSHMTVTQGSNAAVVNWDRFSIGAGASVEFRQPTAQSRILNRVTGNTTSAIHGQLTANGQVHIVNPNGIFIGPTGQVNAGAFVASTLDIGTEDFVEGRYEYSGNGASAGVSNQGRVLIGHGGYAALMGGKVSNSGTVTVPLGRIGFAAGERVTLDVSGDQFLQVAIPSGGGDLDVLIENTGVVSAEGGLIEMRAATARDAARRAINLSGVAEARSVSVRNGKIVLGGGAGGTVSVSGKVSTRTKSGSTKSKSTPAPTIELTGQKIALIGARIVASADEGGGEIRIGGDFGGNGYLQHAATVSADSNTHIAADALDTGDGGQIVVWSDQRTTFAGTLSAQGGDEWGDGGFIEVSSKLTLAYSGLADTRAANGVWGTLLLDPVDITIDPGAGGEDNLEANLAVGNVTLDTDDCCTSENGDITINADIDWAAATQLNLQADGDILLNGAINGAAGTFRLNAVGSIQADNLTNLSVASFRLDGGNWSETGETLSTFTATDFRIDGAADFVRASFDGVSGEYRVSDVYGLQGIGGSTLSGATVVISQNIDASVTSGWTQADGSGFLPINSFNGTLSGSAGSNVISNLFINGFGDGSNDAAFIDTIGVNGNVSNLVFNAADVRGAGAAVLAMVNDGAVSAVSVAGTVNSDGLYTGGLIAINTGTINDSAASVGVTSNVINTENDNYIGGLVGWNTGTINRSNATGDITVTNSALNSIINVGGLVGVEGSNFTINDSYAQGDVTVTAGSAATVYAGGLVGTIYGTVNRSYSSGAVSASGSGTFNAAGFAGEAFGTTNGNFFDRNTSGFSTSPGAAPLDTSTFQNTESFISVGSGQGWDFATVWAPGDTGFYPVNYSTSSVLLAEPDPLTVQYGLTPSAVAPGSIRGGPASYVFDADDDTLDTSSILSSLTFSSQTVGAQTFTVDSANLDSANGVTYRVIDRPGSATITAAPITVSPDGISKTYGSVATLSAFSVTAGSLYFSDSLDDLDMASAGTVATATVEDSPYEITGSNATGTGLSNYTITYGTGDLTVNPAPLTVTADDGSKVYGTTFTPTVYSTSGLLNSDSVASVDLASAGSAATATVSGAPYDIVASNATGSGLGNYTISYVAGALSVSQAPLSITAADDSKTYGTTLTPTGYTTTGLLNADSVSSVDLTSAGSAATATVTGAPYDIDASNAGGTGLANYAITYVSGALSVSQAALTITADDASKVYGQSFAPTGFSTMGLLNADTIDSVVLTSAGSATTANVSGSPYTITGSNASGTGVGNYAITYAPGALSVTPAPLSVTANDATKIYGQSFTPTSFSTTGLQNSDTVDDVTLTSAGSDESASIDGSPYVITPSNATGSGLDNYTLTYVDGSLYVQEASAGDDTPVPPSTVPERGLSNPDDTFIGFAGSQSVDAARETLELAQNISESLEIAANSCGTGGGDVGRYLACLSDALNDFAGELDSISTDLPPGMENVAQIVQAARTNINNARSRAATRLAGAQTDAERRAITADAVAEARSALSTASSEIRKAISLVRAEDPELAAIQRATVTTVASSMDNVGIQLSRVVEL